MERSYRERTVFFSGSGSLSLRKERAGGEALRGEAQSPGACLKLGSRLFQCSAFLDVRPDCVL